jgi:hypothetical protein
VFSKRFMKPSKKVIFWNCFYYIVLQNHSFVHYNRSRGVLRKIFRQKSRVPLKFARLPNPPIILTMSDITFPCQINVTSLKEFSITQF